MAGGEMMAEFRRIAVIGAGAWGTALAAVLAGKGCHVVIWAYEAEVADAINAKRENPLFLPGAPLPASLKATGSVVEALRSAGLAVVASPSHVLRSVIRSMAPALGAGVPIVSATKGIEEESLQLGSQVIEDELGLRTRHSLAVLSGPSFAIEVCQGHPTAVVLAGDDRELVKTLQTLFTTPRFRVYGGSDVIGVQLGGALKNVIALAAGVVDGLGLGHNTRAALITRGLAEIVRLGRAMGAVPQTFYGLSGVGDLVLTCTGTLSRNHAVGARLGRGEKLDDILRDMRTVAEGVRTARAAQRLAGRHGVELPLTQQICAILFEGKAPRSAVQDLMERTAKEELAGEPPLET
jgi:glycerol-3-phosphate dehydrogenase (NAD(P)+)